MDTQGEMIALKKEKDPASVRLLDDDCCWKTAYLVVASCRNCGAQYYPDRYTFDTTDGESEVNFAFGCIGVEAPAQLMAL